MKQHAIFNGLNQAVMDMARRMKLPRVQISDFAPQTIEDVMRSYSETGSIVVWSGGSDSTIYVDPMVNYMFRAAHDMMHIRIGADFTMLGETRVAHAQMGMVGTELGRIIEIEVIKQAEYFFQTGSFLDDQVAFTIAQLKGSR